MLVTISGIANPPISNGSITTCCRIPALSNSDLKNVSENRAGKTTGLKLISTTEIEKRKTIQDTLLCFSFSYFSIMLQKTSLF